VKSEHRLGLGFCFVIIYLFIIVICYYFEFEGSNKLIKQFLIKPSLLKCFKIIDSNKKIVCR